VALLSSCACVFFFNDAATTEIYTLSLHDALPIWAASIVTCWKPSAWSRMTGAGCAGCRKRWPTASRPKPPSRRCRTIPGRGCSRSEEHTSELQSRENLVCRLLLEKKKKTKQHSHK